VTDPPLAKKSNFTVNRASAGHPVKSMLMFVVAVCPGARFAKINGMGDFNAGLQVVPNVCVKVKLLTCVSLAPPGPLFRKESVQALALPGPLLPTRFPEMVVGNAVKFATTSCGWFMMT